MAEVDGSLKFDTKIDDTGFQSSLNKLGGIAKKGIIAISAALAAGTAAVVKFGSEFESGMAKVSTIADESKKSLDELSKGVIKMSNESGKSATELSDALYQAISAGVDTANAVDFVSDANKLAVAGFTDTSSAVDALSTVLNGYKMDATMATKVSDMMLQTQNKGKTTVDELAHSLAQVTPTASAMSVGFDQVSAALATMTAQGVPTAQATTQLNSLFAELGKSGTQANEALKSATEGTKYAGKSFQDLMASGVPLNEILDLMSDYAAKNDKSLLDMFSSIEAGKSALTMSGKSAKTYTQNLKAMKDAAGSTEDAYEKMTDTFEFQSDRMKESVKNLAIEIYDGVKGPLKDIAKLGSDAVADLTAGFEQGGMAGLAQAGVKLISNLITGINTQFPLIITKGLELVTNLSQGLVTGIPVFVGKALDAIQGFADNITQLAPVVIQKGYEVLSNLIAGITDALPELIAKVPTIISTFANVINDNFPTILVKGGELLWQLITGILGAIPALIENIPKIIKAIVDVILAYNWWNLGKNIINFFGNGIKGMVGFIKSKGGEIFHSVLDALKNLPQTLWNLGKDMLGKMGNSITNASGTVKGAVNGIFDLIINGFKSLPSKMLDIGKNLIEGLWNGIGNMKDWILDKIGGFTDSIVSGIKDFFGINSPSKLMRDEIGKFLPMGIEVGFSNQLPKTMTGINDELSDEINSMRNTAVEFSSSRPTENTVISSTVIDRDIEQTDNGEGIDYRRMGNEMVNAFADANVTVSVDERPFGRIVKEVT